MDQNIIELIENQGRAFEAFEAKRMSELEDLNSKLKRLEAAIGRPGSGADSLGNNDWSQTNKSSGWADENGDPVRILKPNELWGERDVKGIALGDAVRALVTGPRNEMERKALSEGTSTAGGFTVPAPLATWYIDRLRAQSVVVKAGAVTIPMASQTMALARLETDPTIGWRAENSAIAEGDPTFGRVILTAKSLAGIVKISRELFADTVNAGAIIEQALLRTMALELDRAAVFGDGTGNSPTGILGTAGINEVSMGTNGLTLTNYDKLIDTLYELQIDNVEQVTGGILHPRTEAAMAKFKDTTNNPLVPPKMVAEVPRFATTAAPIAETQGTSTDCSSLIYGDFRHLFLGMREDINIRILDQRFAEVGQIAILVHARADVQLAQKASFSRLRGIRP